MSFEDFSQDPVIEGTDALGPEPFFPLPQHTDAPAPELFDQFLAGLDLDFPFEQPIPIISTPSSALTYSTDEVTSSQYSSDLTQSEYSIPSDIGSYSSLNDALYVVHDSIHSESAGFSNDLLFIQPLYPAEAQTYSTNEATSSHCPSDFTQSEYSIPSEIGSHSSSNYGPYEAHDPPVFSNDPPSIQPQVLHLAEAQFDFGTSDLSPNVGISPEDLSTAIQPPTSVVPTPLPVDAKSDSEEQMAPAQDKPFKCPLCSYSADRSYNLETHIGTHYKLKKFKCSICGDRFTRNNDLKRHCENPNIQQKHLEASLQSQP